MLHRLDALGGQSGGGGHLLLSSLSSLVALSHEVGVCAFGCVVLGVEAYEGAAGDIDYAATEAGNRAAVGSGAAGDVGVRHIDKKEKTGTIMFGDHKGEEYKSVTESHNEFFVKNFTRAFKK